MLPTPPAWEGEGLLSSDAPRERMSPRAETAGMRSGKAWGLMEGLGCVVW